MTPVAGARATRRSRSAVRRPRPKGGGIAVLAIARVPAWIVLIVLGLLLAPVYLALTQADRDLVYAGVACATPILIAVAIAHYRPRHQVWALVGLGAALMAAGELAWIADAMGLSGGTLADPLYLLGYVPLCAAMAGAARRQGTGIGPAIDAAILAVAAAAVMWFLVIGPALADSTLSLPAAAVAIAYPIADVVVLAFLLRVLLDRPRATPALRLFAIGVTTFLVSDVAYSVLVAEDSYASGLVDLGWMAGYLMWAAAACHPSMAIMRVRTRVDTHISNRRLVVLAVASTVPLLVAAMDQVRASGVDPLPAVLASVVMFLLVVARLTELVRDQRVLIDERGRMQTELERLSMEDALTGLANRRGFGARLEGSIGEGGGPAAVMLLDLDDFKEVNDTLGHGAGDAVLSTVGRRLRAGVRGRDTVARLGGDEFAVLMSDATGAASAIALGERLLADIREPIQVGDTQVRVGASVGIALASGSVSDADTLMRHADLALYRAKEATGRRIEVYDEDIRQESARSLAIRGGIAGAVARQELFLAYEPIVDPVTSRPVAVEGLLRWEHPELGVLMPSEFLQRAGSSDLVAIGAWMVDRAVHDALGWRTATGPLRVNLDLAIAQLKDEGLVETIRSVITRSGIAPARLVLEVTESMLEVSPDVRERLTALSELGVSLAIDDFGTGYSSLARVGDLPVRELKIDRTLLQGDRRLLGAVRQFGASLGVRVVMEGVQDKADLELVEELGFDGIQGPAVERPLRAAEVARSLGRHPHTPAGRADWRPVVDRGMI